MTDELRDIPGYEGLYAVTREGRVWTHRTQKWIKLSPINGYLRLPFSIDGKRGSLAAHRCVALAWIPNPDGKPQINHINGVKSDNRVENLEWVTRSENSKHAWATGLSRVTEAHLESARKAGLAAAGRKYHKKTHCLRGHEMTPDNTYVNKRGQWSCIACRQVWYVKNNARERAKRAARRSLNNEL